MDGWCPNAAAAGTVRRRYAAPEGEVGTAAREGSQKVVEGALVDYGPIGTPAIYLILPVAGALLIGCLAVTAPPAGRLILLGVILAFSGVELYSVIRRARVEISSEAITIRRPLFRPIVIPKDAVVKAEVGENKLPVPSCSLRRHWRPFSYRRPRYILWMG
ncbi:DUF1673 family protein [Methanoculleus chikugoensis]|uniref:DUF1673 family protein n=1 Tax=Methanoculleus chikugoensis TaxID=118126 RepID=UPI0006D24F0F|nr:DUF1673 family protein [Methanoculleus chikugoensis]